VSFKDKAGEVGNFAEEPGELDEALKDFRLSVHAWSDAVYSRPRTAVAPRQVWRMAAGWALGCVLVAGGASAGVWQHHQREMKSAAARVAEQERMAVQQRNQKARQEDEDLLAKVDRDVSREVPAAMEPLAQMMTEDKTP
jgi:phosphoketolase